MNGLTVDASVWVAAQDPGDPVCPASRAFLHHVLAAGITLHVPALARVEVACALARKLRNPAEAQRLANLLLMSAGVREHSLNTTLMAKALAVGTACFLRGADAVYVATAEQNHSELVSWDQEHIQRANAVRPDAWLAANA